MTVEVFDPPVRPRRSLARTTNVLVLLFGFSAGFLGGVGFALVAIDQSVPALRCASFVERGP